MTNPDKDSTVAVPRARLKQWDDWLAIRGQSVVKPPLLTDAIRNEIGELLAAPLPECGTSEKCSTISAKNAAGRDLPAAAGTPLPFESGGTQPAGMGRELTSAQQPAPAAPSDWQFSNETFARLEKMYEAALYAEKGVAMHGYEHEALARRVVYESLLRDVAAARSASGDSEAVALLQRAREIFTRQFGDNFPEDAPEGLLKWHFDSDAFFMGKPVRSTRGDSK